MSRAAVVVPGGTPIPLINNAYLIDPFTATAVSYTAILLTWNGPDPSTATPMTEFRLLSSRYGYPVDENDGNVLFDTTTLPGTSYLDQNVIPGEITYYAFYINTGTSWVRSGFTACLMPVNHDYASRLYSYLPEYLRDTGDDELTATDATGNPYLQQWLQIAGWAVDYLKTQYDFLYNYQNDPMSMSFSDLANLAAQLGMPFPSEIPAYDARIAVQNWATIMRQRGSLPGIAENISALTGFSVDAQVSRNIMLENDQSQPSDPGHQSWSAGTPYKAGEIVQWPVYPSWVPSQAYIVDNYVVYEGTNYQCIATGGQGVPPAGAVDSSTYWSVAAGPYFYVCISPITSLPGTAPPAAPVADQTPTANNSNWQLVYDFDSMPPYDASVAYTQGEFAAYAGNLYVCIAPTVTGTAPTGSNSNNADWAYVRELTQPLNSNGDFAGGSGLGWTAYEGTFSITTTPPAGGVAQYAALFTISTADAGAALEESGAAYAVTGGESYMVTAWVYTPETSVTLGFDWQDSAGTYLSTSTTSITVTASTWTSVSTTQTAPADAAFSYPRVAPTDGAGNEIYVENVVVTALLNQDRLYIPGLAGGENTWEVLQASGTTPSTAAVGTGSLLEGLGLRNPANWGNDFSQHSFRVTNRSGSTTDQWLRSVSRGPADVLNGTSVPDPQLVVEHGIPVPQTIPEDEWTPSIRYATGDVVMYNGVSYLAQRASTGATPPSVGVPVNENYTFEGSITPWTALGGTASESTAEAYQGADSLLLTPSGSGSAGAWSERFNVIPNAAYTASAYAYIPAGWSNTTIVIWWFDAFGDSISDATSATYDVAADTWTPLTLTATAPPNAATGQLVLSVNGSPTTSTLSYWDLAEVTCASTPEWLPLGTDSRIPLVMSAETIQNVSVSSAEQFAIYPFAEWYDSWGNLITRVFARNTTAGTAGNPPSYTFDSFQSGAGTPLAGRLTDTQDQYWDTKIATGGWMLDGSGNVYATGSTGQSMAVVSAPLSCTQAVTFTEAPQSGTDLGLVFWYQTASDVWWHAGMSGLYYFDSGANLAATYPVSFVLGDRIYVVTDQSTPSISVYRNFIQSYDSASGNGLVASLTSIPSAVLPASGTTVYSGIASEAV